MNRTPDHWTDTDRVTARRPSEANTHPKSTSVYSVQGAPPAEYVPPQCLFVSLKTSVETYQEGNTATIRSQSALGTSECKGILILEGIGDSKECRWAPPTAARADVKGGMRGLGNSRWYEYTTESECASFSYYL
jgi:hypothetical protein